MLEGVCGRVVGKGGTTEGEEEGMIEAFQARAGRNGVGCGLLL